MEQYISKSAVFAKIRGYINNAETYLKYHHNRNDKSVYAFEQEKLLMCELLSSLDTLEVREVDNWHLQSKEDISVINNLEVKEVGLQEEPVSEDLEEAAHHYYMPFETFMDGFKKGAKWQKKRDYLEWNGKIDSKEAEGTLKKMLDEMDEQKSAK